MGYNVKYLDIKYALMQSFMLDMEDCILDISYIVDDQIVTVQVVLVEGNSLSNDIKERARKNLAPMQMVINEIHISSVLFYAGIRNWQPEYYSWLPYLLFSKADKL